MGIINVVKRLFNKDKQETKEEDFKPDLEKVESTPERIEVKRVLDSTLHCFKCGRASGFYKITLKKVKKGKYVCTDCQNGG